jgi:16S rRNA (uracil1498-N3)-methyltransferase
MRRFFIPTIPDTPTFDLPEEESKHMIRVLRMQVNEPCLLLNGKGALVEVVIENDHPKKCGVRVVKRTQVERTEGFHLAIAPTKNMDRMEWMVEKIVEIGATKLSFIQCEHSERVQLKIERLERVAIAAMKQAQHDFLLDIQPLVPVLEFMRNHPNGCIAHCATGTKIAVKDAQFPQLILVGPEGDFSPKEIESALAQGYEAVHLGTSRLRTETAGLVATVLATHRI